MANVNRPHTTDKNQALVALKLAFPPSLPVMAAFLFLGATYGIVSTTSGFPAWLPPLTALVVYTGSFEFLLVGILMGPFDPVGTFVSALLVGARHVFYGISMLNRYRGYGLKSFYMIYTMADEAFALNYSAQLPPEINRGWYYFWTSLLCQLYWVAGAALGGVSGGLIPFDTTGLDFILTCMFAAIFLLQLDAEHNSFARFQRKPKEETTPTDSSVAVRLISRFKRSGLCSWAKVHSSALIGLVSSLVSLAIFGPQRFMVPAMVSIVGLLMLLRRPIAQWHGHEQLDLAQTQSQSEAQNQTQATDAYASKGECA